LIRYFIKIKKLGLDFGGPVHFFNVYIMGMKSFFLPFIQPTIEMVLATYSV